VARPRWYNARETGGAGWRHCRAAVKIKDIMNKPDIAAALLLFLILAGPVQAAGDSRLNDLAAANMALASGYRTLMNQQHSPRDRSALRDLERDWIAYKDKECLSEVGGADGVAQRPGMALWPNYADCQLRVTRARTQELKAMECAGASVCALHHR
jgi:uncharacterized protein YecT (DUF1311 family)